MSKVPSTIRIGILLFFAAAITPRATAQAPVPQPPAEPAKATTPPAPDLATVAAQEEFIKSAVFDVASIHKFKSDGRPVMQTIRNDPDGFTSTHNRILDLVCYAYGASFYQVLGAPDWVHEDHYDVIAKTDEHTANTLHSLSGKQANMARRHMLQVLLADRFKLKIHTETRQLPIYKLVIAKGGSKLHEAKTGDEYANGLQSADGKSLGRGGMNMRFDSGAMVITAQGRSVDQLISQVSGQVGSRVEDDTGLKGHYDFTLRYTPDYLRATSPNTAASGDLSTSDDSGTSIFAALEDQLGLKLEPQKGPVDVIVIDHVEPPSEN